MNHSPKENDNDETKPIRFDLVSELSRSFADQLNSGRDISLESYLEEVTPNTQSMLLRNLLHIEMHHRQKNGDAPTADEYNHRFSKHEDLVEQVFAESLEISNRSVETDDSLDVTMDFIPPVSDRLGSYILEHELGRGGMGVVYQARHAERGNRVALKLLPEVDGKRLHKFKREFRSLAEINHPNLIGLHNLESDGGRWFFTMDIIRNGEHFLKYIRPNGKFDEAKFRASFPQLVAGVIALHSHQIVHRDLKPGNVMVDEEGQVFLLDFGLVDELERRDLTMTEALISGTPAYMAPEQAAQEEVTPASDWYAVGVILYQALCGKLPFNGKVMQLLQQKLHNDAPPLPDEAKIPDDLRKLTMKLLERQPAKRPSVSDMSEWRTTDSIPKKQIAQFEDEDLIGREEQLNDLKEAFDMLQTNRQPMTVFISGKSGEGKSSLWRHFIKPIGLRHSEFALMSGRCYDRESVPFKALDTLIDALATFLRSLPTDQSAMLMPRDIAVLAHVFPTLQRVDVVAQAPRTRVVDLDEQQVRQRAFGALRELLWRLSDRTPVIWFVDDLQWGDADSAEALFEILRPPEAPVVWFVGTFRSDEVEGSQFLKKWEQLQRFNDVTVKRRDIHVGPLSIEQCAEVMTTKLGLDTPELHLKARDLAQEVGGNPLLLSELLGNYDSESKSFRSLPLHEVIEQKLSRLPSDSTKLLGVIAVSGQEVSWNEAIAAAACESESASTLTHMRNERLVRFLGTDQAPMIDTYHDKIRENVLAKMDEKLKRTTHRDLASAIEASQEINFDLISSAIANNESDTEKRTPIHRVYDLAYHYDAAGDQHRALTYSLFAAEQAERQFALEVAAEQFEIAKRNSVGSANAIHYRIARGYGRALMLLARYEDASKELEGSIDLTNDLIEKVWIEITQGDVAFKKGDIDASVRIFESGLRRLGVWVPRTQLGTFCGMFKEIVIQGGQSLFRFALHRRTMTERDQLVIHLLWRLTQPYMFQNTLSLMWCQFSNFNRVGRFKRSSFLAPIYGTNACVASMLGLTRLGAKYGGRAMEIANEYDDKRLFGYVANYYGIGLYASAQFEKGISVLDQAIQSTEACGGDKYEINIAHFHKGCCQYGLGQLAEAVQEARWTFDSATKVCESRAMCSSWLWARATEGNFPFEKMKSCIPDRPDDVMSTVHVKLAEGLWHDYHGRSEAALQVCESAAKMVRKSLCFNSHTVLVAPMIAKTTRARAKVLENTDPKAAEKLFKRSLRAGKWAVRLTMRFPAAYPVALRELGESFLAIGKTKKALKYFTKSCYVAKRQKAEFEFAQSDLLRAKLNKEMGRSGAGQALENAEKQIESFRQQAREFRTLEPLVSPR